MGRGARADNISRAARVRDPGRSTARSDLTVDLVPNFCVSQKCHRFSRTARCNSSVQLDTFDRQLSGTPDALVGCEQSLLPIDDTELVRTSGQTHHPIVKYIGAANARVSGTVFEITTQELEHADRYEVSAYERVVAPLSSGRTAWVYVDAKYAPPSDDGASSQALFQLVVLRLAVRQAEPPAIIVDHDADMVRIVEGCRAALECRILEVPPWRSYAPDELGKVVCILFIAGSSALRGEVVLVPPLELGRGWQGHLAGRLTADQIATYGNECPAAVWPKRRNDVCAACSPESNPARIASWILSASIRLSASRARAEGCPLRNVSPETNRVVP